MNEDWPLKERRKVNQEDHDILINISSDVKHIIEWNKGHQTQDDDRHKENIFRITALERSKWQIIGGVSVMGFVISIAVKYLM